MTHLDEKIYKSLLNLMQEGENICVSSVARDADVSRTTVYNKMYQFERQVYNLDNN